MFFGFKAIAYLYKLGRGCSFELHGDFISMRCLLNYSTRLDGRNKFYSTPLRGTGHTHTLSLFVNVFLDYIRCGSLALDGQ